MTDATIHPNVQLLQRYWQATTTGDLKTMMALLADDVVYHYPGQHYLSGDHRGKEAVAGKGGLFDTLSFIGVRSGMFEGFLHEVPVGNEFSVVVISYRLHVMKRRSLPGRACGLFRIVNGKVQEYWLFEWDQRMINDSVWAGAPRVLLRRRHYLLLIRSLPRIALGLVGTARRLFTGYRAPTSV